MVTIRRRRDERTHASAWPDQELRLQLERLGSTVPVLVVEQLQLQLDLANAALRAPEAVLQLDLLQLDRA